MALHSCGVVKEALCARDSLKFTSQLAVKYLAIMNSPFNQKIPGPERFN
jgi:hypothetical protein